MDHPGDGDDYIDDLLDLIRKDRWPLRDDIFTGEALLKIAKASAHRAGGSDDLAPDDLALLPLSWWDSLARLWKVVIDTGRVPDIWARVCMILLGKASGGHRVLGIAAIAWRIGGKALVKSLAPWCATWAREELAGGMPGRTAHSVHARLRFDWNRAKVDKQYLGVMLTDLSKCFDTVSHKQIMAILDALGAPIEIIRLIEQFYAHSIRLMTMEGASTKAWFAVKHGVLQGCPFSMLLLAALMRVWIALMDVKAPNCSKGVYVDDRSIWSRARNTQQVAADIALAMET